MDLLINETLAADGSTAQGDIDTMLKSDDLPLAIGASGTFGGGTLTVEYSFDAGVTWLASTFTLTANGVIEIPRPGGLVRATLAGATAPSVLVQVG